VILKLARKKRPNKPDGAAHLGLTDPIWETVQTCWETRPSDRLTVAQVLEVWEKEINGGDQPVGEPSERRASRQSPFLFRLPPLPQLIGLALDRGTPWWKFVCGGSEKQYAE